MRRARRRSDRTRLALIAGRLTPVRLVPVLVVATLIVAACGSDGDDDQATGSDGDDTAASADGGEDATTSTTASTSTVSTTGDSTTNSAPSSTTSTTGDSTTSSTTTSAPTSSTSTTNASRPDLVDVRAVPIRSVRSPGGGSLELTVEGGVEPCFIIDRVDVVETGEQVELTVHAGSEPGAICIQIIELHTTTVTLDQPLDGRTVVDGTSGQPLDVAA